ncbi:MULTISPECIES: hypothetical protein [unclassified Eikenella]|uniref:hypothetical protein n=1 Tax=unclassified Eikenella TaxID=2639367 RepID=UPI0007E2A327|nr:MULTISPECIES: hypothetical protein [unclassified Eikenella]OAM27972.1 hypothetical protein A7P94_04375 [Eikenella sp. NML01-A-086]OAM42708.1 hypothetical protein A7Q02_02710 [Eikenella sp. NML97-A-109]
MAKKRKPSISALPPALFPYIQQANDDTLLLFTGMMPMTITRYVPFGNANWLGVKLNFGGAVCAGGHVLPEKPAAIHQMVDWLRPLHRLTLHHLLTGYV